ncbi:MAG: bifunctional methylenetetrahydrofolate dehydrogenase/methenyltetrahydrofolate cyclohydrolase FolD [Clostridiales bacterium]|jgi:methylenetetrahydrofolate dehydrogenase (NADP+)/methenyltetrahydrofolate cyclohydrolase|nr:bifunctional methylenetetrahydrofolate dehydrogenase/methenyltetrahydrofolate cyclohydrolase FolD [Clostridiales bacterium]
MSAILIDGKARAAALRLELKNQIEKENLRVALAVIMVGDDPASAVYVKNKEKACQELGIQSFMYYLPAATPEAKLVELISALNADKNVNGILVQLPLPKGLDTNRVLAHIDPLKDVDGFLAASAGALMIGAPGLRPCTPSGIMDLIAGTGVPLAGKTAVVVGRSNIVGKPVALMLLERSATVTVAHSKTENLSAVTRTADILVVAVGRAELIRGADVKPGAVVIDVGMNRTDRLVGDVAFNEVREVAAYLTPVPGGVGPMTIAMLMQNTVKAHALQHG